MTPDQLSELEDRLRGLVARGVVLRVDDTGPVQLVDVQTHPGVIRTGIEVHHMHGDASNAPLDGARVLLLAVGGDQGDMVAIPAARSATRMGGLKPGERAVHDDAGNRLLFRDGVIVEVAAITGMTVVVAGTAVLDVVHDGASITGTLVVSGDVHAGGASGVSLLTHTHGGVMQGGSDTAKPNPG